MKTLSVLTLAKGRPAHLVNMMLGLARQSVLPHEFIIAVMQDTLYDNLPEMPFPVRQVKIDPLALRLSAARNRAASLASGEALVFLDIDCIPAPDCLHDYQKGLTECDGLLMGEVMYLPAGASQSGWTYAGFEQNCARHSDRRGPPAEGVEICSDYRCFWSLNFAIRRDSFMASGGFDESYVGYGGEDTDYAKGFTLSGGMLGWLKGALVYHQHHAHHMPPVHHLETVVKNAERFEGKWGYRTMGHWLHAFRLMGLIDDTAGRPIRILRQPDEADLALTGQQSHQPYANTASVIRILEQRTAPLAQSLAAE
ncbi:glycosyltransferase [Asaia siamensis]|uniref:Glycosyl transferase family A n=1 Tax=Asaia siamensis TaxID=110479 RepID=A0ABQ1L5B1_9PROT|nr:galactosyltransferase-related protein [Asaia siamensis]GBR09540.1 sugar transferase [Asaia siamensis NRIC 0323]GGC19790.1 glycosyl transferase family A [Asaia siamensis]